MINLADALFWYIAFLLSTTFHEAAHAFAAYKFGDRTAYENGQVSLNPVPHIKTEPIGMVLVPIISFFIGGWMIGWAKTPYNYNWACTYPKKAALMSAAGPVANFILLVFSALLIHLGMQLGYFYAPESITISSAVGTNGEGTITSVAKLLSILFSLNLILFIFNLIPVPPLDGSGMIPLWLSKKTAVKYMEFIRNPAFTFMGILIAWKVFDLIFSRIHLLFINLLYPGSNYQ